MKNKDNLEFENQDNNQKYENQEYDVNEYFQEPKSKIFGWIILIIIILVIIGFGIYYYFVLDNPKTIFSHAIDSSIYKISNISKQDSLNVELSIESQIYTNNEDYQSYINILNNLSFDASFKIDNQNNIAYGNILTKYDNEDFLDISALVELDNNLAGYFKLNNILDKSIKVSLSDGNNKDNNQNNTSLNDYQTIIDEIEKAMIKTLTVSKLKKEYVKYNNQIVKKVTLIIDKSNITYFFDELTKSDNFMNSYQLIMNTNKEEIENNITKIIDEYQDETISLYLTVLKNEFLLMEYTSNDKTLKITNDNNKYSMELFTPSKVILQGSIKKQTIDNKESLIITLDDLQENISIEIDLLYQVSDLININKLDTNDSILIDELSEKDLIQIYNQIKKNNTLMKILEDLEFKIE